MQVGKCFKKVKNFECNKIIILAMGNPFFQKNK